GWCFAKHCNYCCIGGKSTWQLHGVRKLIRRNALQHQLTGIGVLPFVPLQRDISQAESNESEEHDYEEEQPVVNVRRHPPPSGVELLEFKLLRADFLRTVHSGRDHSLFRPCYYTSRANRHRASSNQQESPDRFVRASHSSLCFARLTSRFWRWRRSVLHSSESCHRVCRFCDALHHQRNALQLSLERFQCESGNRNFSHRVAGLFSRNTIAVPGQKHLDQFGCVLRVKPLEQFAPQRR